VAAIVDGVVSFLMVLPVLFFLDYLSAAVAGTVSLLAQLGVSILSLSLFVAVNGYLMATAGQTIGKRMLEIRVVDAATGEVPRLARLVGLRYGPMWLVGVIPVVGAALSTINVLMIFRGDRRCVHDHLAGTKVVRA
jgi:uncharacterized RDD family membrane protein YckC